MTSSMLAGERRWASARRGGMTVLGKVAVPKPINLPSQKLENHGLDPNVEIVPKGSLSWGSRPSSSTSNPWGSSAVSPNADGSSVSPSGRPSSGGGLSRPSTAGSDRHEPSTTTWGPNSRPSSASGVLTSNQSSLTSSRPLSAETRPGSAHLSRFAEPAYDTPVAWGPNGTADKLSVPSKANDFSLSSGDFPTLGSEKDNSGKSSEQHDQGSHVRPGSGAGRTAPAADRNAMAPADHKSGTVDTWTRDSSHHFEDGVRPSADNWQHGDPQQYINPNIPPQHFDAWRGPPMNAPPASVWYRGPPPAGPPYPPVPHGGYPMEPYHYYRPQLPPNLANSQSGPPPGPVPRGHHPRNGDFYRPQMHEPFIRPGMPIRPGFYPGPVPYDGYYGPPMIYNPNDRDMQFMGMPPGPHGPPVYNMGPPQNPSELHDPHFRSGGRRSVGNKRPRNASPPWRQDDKDGHYVFAIGDNLTPRYKIHGKMGEGTFGQVFECWDKERKEMVAIKILRGIKKYCEAAMIEIDVLQQLGKHDKGGNRCVQLRNWFDYRNHICIVFEKLGPSLYDFLRENNYRSYPIDVVREIGRQLLECIAFMHDLRLIHTDLKPENILLVTPEYVKVPDYKGSSRSQKDSSYSKRVPKSSAIKVIDFGSTTYDRQDQSYIVSTRHYRAPEVILGLGWSYPCDIWSVGCILVELCSGETLFQTHENLEHLAMMERVLGQLPMHMLKKADRHAEKYVRKGRLDWPEGAASRDSIKAVTKLPRLQNLIKQHVDHSAGDLIHLLQGLLKYDPSERVTARAALRHPFFTRDHLGSF